MPTSLTADIIHIRRLFAFCQDRAKLRARLSTPEHRSGCWQQGGRRARERSTRIGNALGLAVSSIARRISDFDGILTQQRDFAFVSGMHGPVERSLSIRIGDVRVGSLFQK